MYASQSARALCAGRSAGTCARAKRIAQDALCALCWQTRCALHASAVEAPGIVRRWPAGHIAARALSEREKGHRLRQALRRSGCKHSSSERHRRACGALHSLSRLSHGTPWKYERKSASSEQAGHPTPEAGLASSLSSTYETLHGGTPWRAAGPAQHAIAPGAALQAARQAARATTAPSRCWHRRSMVPTHPWVDLELLEPAILAEKFLNAAYTRRAGKVFDQGRQQTLEMGPGLH